jgi:hypothetical protein
MGVDTNIHIGPYMTVKGKKTEMLDREVRTCSNKKCETHKKNQQYSESQKFCAECGAEVSLKKYKEKWVSGPDSLISDEPYEEEFCDELCCTDNESEFENTFISNERSPFDKKRDSIDEYSGGEVDLTDVNPQEEIVWFKKRYKKIIDVFHKEYGPESTTFKWGVIQWYS